MCGIVGMSFRRDETYREREIKKLRELFTQALVKAQARGSAATSVTLMSRESNRDVRPKVLTLRSPLAAEEFVKSDKYKKVLSKLDTNSLSIIGHTRAVTGAATAKNNQNNHPHIFGPIVGVHNGCIVNHEELWKKYEAFEDMEPRGECDSEVLFALINHHLDSRLKNTEVAICMALLEVEGWYAMALVNMKEPEKVYILRDGATPLEMAWWTYGETAMFASSYDFLEGPFRNTNMAGKLRRHYLDPMTVVTLDSGVIASGPAEFHVHVKQVLGGSDFKKAELIKDHKEAYDISQGRTQG